MSNKLLIVCCLLALFSCTAKKKLVERKADTTATVKAVLNNLTAVQLAAINQKQVDFNTFSGKARTKLAIDSQSNDVTLNVRIKKDQQIWVSVTYVVGVEVARALITPDSIKLMNRVENTYLKKPFSYIYQYTSQQINFATLQAIFTGNIIPGLLTDSAIVSKDNADIVLKGKLHDIVYQLVLGADLKATVTNMANPRLEQSIQIDNSDFVQSVNRIIPSKIDINSSSKLKKVKLQLNYIKTDFDQVLEYPFTVPGRFSLVN